LFIGLLIRYAWPCNRWAANAGPLVLG